MRYLMPDPDAPPPTRTAVIVPIADADPLVDRHRRQFDTAASWGVPAHVTVIYPFLAPDTINSDVVADLITAVRSVRQFSCVFRRLAWFGGDVLYLEPEPDGPFRALTGAVGHAFPDAPPYGGAHDEVVPHLTVAQRALAGPSQMRAVAREVKLGLPVLASVDHALLVAGSDAPRSWRTLRRLPLGNSQRSGSSTR